MPVSFNPNDPAQFAQPQPGQFPFEARNAAIEQRKKLLAELMRRQTQQPDMPEGRMVSGHYVAPSWAENLNAAIQPVMQRWKQEAQAKALQADQEAYNKADQAAGLAHIQARPQARPELQGPQAEDGSPELAAVTPTNQQMAEWAQKGAAIPSRRDVVAKIMADLEVNAPIREDARTQRNLDREDAQTDRKDSLAANLQLKREQLIQQAADSQRRSEDTRLGIEQRREAARAHGDLMKQMAGDRRAMIAAQIDAKANPPAKPLPASQATAWVNNNSAIANIDNAMGKLEGAPDATGLKGYLPNVALSRMGTDDEKSTRAAVANIGSLKIHDRSGAVVTVSETPRLLPFIPTVNDDAKTAKVKLNGLKEEYQRMQQSIQDFAGDTYRMPKSSNASPGVTGSWGAPPKVSNAADYAKVQSGSTYTDPTGQVRTKP